MDHVSLLGAFVAGVLSIISPGVLPLIPGYLFFVAAAKRALLTSLLFILGFSLVFVAVSASATAIGEFIMQRLSMFAAVAGILLILLGGLIVVQSRITPARHQVAVVVGMAFAFGWAPFIGPTLAAILAIAARQDSAGEGITLLSVYSIGLAIPLLLAALAVNRIRRYGHVIEIASGIVLIVTGALIATGRFTIIAQSLAPYLPAF